MGGGGVVVVSPHSKAASMWALASFNVGLGRADLPRSPVRAQDEIPRETDLGRGDVGYLGGVVRRLLVVGLLLLAVLLAGCQEPLFQSEQRLNPASAAAP